MTDPYQVLGVSPNASDDEIKKAYRDLSRQYHPDAYTDNPLSGLAEEKFKEIQEAYHQIMDMREGRSSGYNGGGYNQGGYGGQGYNQGGFNGQGYNQGNNQGYYNNQNQNYNRQQYDQYGGYYGRGNQNNSDCCNCCCDLWCADTLCECMGGDLCSCI